VGNALLFSGNRIELTNIVLDTNASIALWAKPISGSSDTYSFISSDSSGQNGINLGSNFATLYFKGNDSALVNGVRTSVSGQLPAGFDAEDWHHYCLVSDLSGLYGYVDGELVDSNTSGNAVIDVNGTMEIGHAKDHADRYMLGYLDDVRIYNKALSAAEVKALFNIQY
jgi:hypothetical protein